jgi:hypothetical protein
MIARFLRWLSSGLQRRAIVAEDGKLYLERFRLWGWMPGDARTYRFGVYLHRFHLPDLDSARHNHPWRWAFSIILSGSYTEHADCESCVAMRGHVAARHVRLFNWLSADTFHRIDQLHGEVWTLFIVGPKTSSWGFLVDGQVIPWRDRLAQRGIKADY